MIVLVVLVCIFSYLVVGTATLKFVMLYNDVATLDKFAVKIGSGYTHMEKYAYFTTLVVAWPIVWGVCLSYCIFYIPVRAVGRTVKYVVNLDQETIKVKQAERKTKRIERNLSRIERVRVHK